MNTYNLTIKIRIPEPVKVKKSNKKWELYSEGQRKALIKTVSTFIENTEFYIVDGVYLSQEHPGRVIFNQNANEIVNIDKVDTFIAK